MNIRGEGWGRGDTISLKSLSKYIIPIVESFEFSDTLKSDFDRVLESDFERVSLGRLKTTLKDFKKAVDLDDLVGLGLIEDQIIHLILFEDPQLEKRRMRFQSNDMSRVLWKSFEN